jgi:hypothetical protein
LASEYPNVTFPAEGLGLAAFNEKTSGAVVETD